jgi:hypothetical protein
LSPVAVVAVDRLLNIELSSGARDLDASFRIANGRSSEFILAEDDFSMETNELATM